MASLITLDEAKTQLHIPLATTDRDMDVQALVDEASAVIVNYLKSLGDPTWTAVTAPLPVKRSVKLLIANYDENRGDKDMKNDADCWMAIERLLVRFRDPALA